MILQFRTRQTRWEYRMPCGLNRHSGGKSRRYGGSRNQENRRKGRESAERNHGPSAFSDRAEGSRGEESEKEPVPEPAGMGEKEQLPAAADTKNKIAEQPQNYVIDLKRQETGGEKTRYKWNVDAIKTLKQLESEGRNATPQEQEILAKYAGWGGSAQAFDEKNEGWQKEYAELKTLLTPEEYREARATVTTAFYTPSVVAAAIGEALVQFGFRGGNVLEPSMGTGHFFWTMPE